MRSLQKIAAAAGLAAMLGGCAAPPLYNWGGYEAMLYAGYKDPTKMEAMRTGLEAHLAALEMARQKAPPGIQAELGTLYLQGGAADKAIAMYARERDAWPESKGLMDAMIRNLERRRQSAGEAPK